MSKERGISHRRPWAERGKRTPLGEDGGLDDHAISGIGIERQNPNISRITYFLLAINLGNLELQAFPSVCNCISVSICMNEWPHSTDIEDVFESIGPFRTVLAAKFNLLAATRH